MQNGGCLLKTAKVEKMPIPKITKACLIKSDLKQMSSMRSVEAQQGMKDDILRISKSQKQGFLNILTLF